MSEIINLIPQNPDVHVYAKAVELLSARLNEDYSFIINVWDGEMPDTTKHKRILITTSDEGHNVPSQINDNNYVHIFKQYYPMKDPDDPSSLISSNKVTAIPLCELEGAQDENIPILEREYDWSWMGQFDPFRRNYFKLAIDNLEKDKSLKSKVLWYEGWNNGEPIENYSKIVNQTKIMPVPRGSGSLESFRFFEAAKSGCLAVCTNKPSISFYNVAPFFSIQSWGHLKDFIKNIIKNKEEILFLSKANKYWYNNFCSPEGLADYMYRAIKETNV